MLVDCACCRANGVVEWQDSMVLAPAVYSSIICQCDSSMNHLKVKTWSQQRRVCDTNNTAVATGKLWYITSQLYPDADNYPDLPCEFLDSLMGLLHSYSL